MKTIRKFFALTALLLFTAAFAAGDDFNFTYNGTFIGNTASGTLITTPEGGGQFLITGITKGLVDGVAIASLLPPGSYFGNDNFLFVPPNPGYLDTLGFSFVDANGIDFNVFYSGGDTYAFVSSNSLFDSGTLTVTAVGSQVPEPGSILLLGTGLLGAAFVLRRRFTA